MVPFQKRVKNPQQNGTISGRNVSKFLYKNGTISEKGQKSLTKMVPFQSEKGHNSSTKCTISERGQNSSTKMVPFQKRVKNRQQKWYHFRQKMVKIHQQKWYHFRKGSKPHKKWYHFRKWSKFLNKNGTISEKGQKSSTDDIYSNLHAVQSCWLNSYNTSNHLSF